MGNQQNFVKTKYFSSEETLRGLEPVVRRPDSKLVTVFLDDQIYFEVDVADQKQDKTCGWLLSEVTSKYSSLFDAFKRGQTFYLNHEIKMPYFLRKKNFIVALKTKEFREGIDAWLNEHEKDLSVLRDGIHLAVHFSKINARTRKDGLVQKREMQIDDFEQIRVIGRGGYSRVIMARKKDSGRLYAIKVLQKDQIKTEDDLKSIYNERKIMQQLQHPFLIKLHWAFQNPSQLFFVMDICTGGQLLFHILQQRRLPENLAKFYLSEILLGFKFLHERDIVFRDLKPENIMIDMEGHIRIVDFGLAKFLGEDELSYSVCGSPEYLSPEMLRLGQGHDRRVDIYSLGVLLFEMLTGLPPFYSEDQHEMFNSVVNSELALDQPYLSEQVKNLLFNLLQKNPEKRYQTVQEIMNDSWFDDIKWNQILFKKVIPPMVPDINQSYFENLPDLEDGENSINQSGIRASIDINSSKNTIWQSCDVHSTTELQWRADESIRNTSKLTKLAQIFDSSANMSNLNESNVFGSSKKYTEFDYSSPPLADVQILRILDSYIRCKNKDQLEVVHRFKQQLLDQQRMESMMIKNEGSSQLLSASQNIDKSSINCQKPSQVQAKRLFEYRPRAGNLVKTSKNNIEEMQVLSYSASSMASKNKSSSLIGTPSPEEQQFKDQPIVYLIDEHDDSRNLQSMADEIPRRLQDREVNHSITYSFCSESESGSQKLMEPISLSGSVQKPQTTLVKHKNAELMKSHDFAAPLGDNVSHYQRPSCQSDEDKESFESLYDEDDEISKIAENLKLTEMTQSEAQKNDLLSKLTSQKPIESKMTTTMLKLQIQSSEVYLASRQEKICVSGSMLSQCMLSATASLRIDCSSTKSQEKASQDGIEGTISGGPSILDIERNQWLEMQPKDPQCISLKSQKPQSKKEVRTCQEGLLNLLGSQANMSSQQSSSAQDQQGLKFSNHLRFSSLLSDSDTPKQCQIGLLDYEDPLRALAMDSPPAGFDNISKPRIFDLKLTAAAYQPCLETVQEKIRRQNNNFKDITSFTKVQKAIAANSKNQKGSFTNQNASLKVKRGVSGKLKGQKSNIKQEQEPQKLALMQAKSKRKASMVNFQEFSASEIQLSPAPNISKHPTKIKKIVNSSSAKSKREETDKRTKISPNRLLSPHKKQFTMTSPRHNPKKTRTANFKVPQSMQASSLNSKTNDDSADFSSLQVAEEMQVFRLSMPQEDRSQALQELLTLQKDFQPNPTSTGNKTSNAHKSLKQFSLSSATVPVYNADLSLKRPYNKTMLLQETNTGSKISSKQKITYLKSPQNSPVVQAQAWKIKQQSSKKRLKSPEFVSNKLNIDLPLATVSSKISLMNEEILGNSSNLKSKATEKASFVSTQSLINSTKQKSSMMQAAEAKQQTVRLLRKQKSSKSLNSVSKKKKVQQVTVSLFVKQQSEDEIESRNLSQTTKICQLRSQEHLIKSPISIQQMLQGNAKASASCVQSAELLDSSLDQVNVPDIQKLMDKVLLRTSQQSKRQNLSQAELMSQTSPLSLQQEQQEIDLSRNNATSSEMPYQRISQCTTAEGLLTSQKSYILMAKTCQKPAQISLVNPHEKVLSHPCSNEDGSTLSGRLNGLGRQFGKEHHSISHRSDQLYKHKDERQLNSKASSFILIEDAPKPVQF